jgi:hypothetical protein
MSLAPSAPFAKTFKPRSRLQLIRAFPIAHPLGFPSMSSAPANSIAADLKRDYLAAGFFSSTRMRSIGPLPMFSGRCAPAGVKTASPFLPDISSLLPSG